MAKIRFTVSVDTEVAKLIEKYKEQRQITNTSKASEELIKEGLMTLQARPDTYKGNVLKLIQIAKHLEDMMKIKNC